jgi:hypothetical protein
MGGVLGGGENRAEKNGESSDGDPLHYCTFAFAALC